MYSLLNVETPNHIQFNPLRTNYTFNWKIIILIPNKLGCSVSKTYRYTYLYAHGMWWEVR